MNAPHSKQSNSLNSFPKKNQNYKPPKMNNQKNEGYSSSNNIYSGYSSHTGGNIYAQTNENNNQKPKNNIIDGSSSNRNIYNAPPKINSPVYVPQTSGNINHGYIQKASGDMPLFPSNVSPINDNTNNPTSTEPLIPTKKLELNSKFCHCCECCECCECIECIECCNCCQCIDCCECCDTNYDMEEIKGRDKCCIIIFCVILAAIDIYDIIITLISERNNYILCLIPDLLYLFFVIFEPITTMRVRWLRITGSVLSVVYLVLSIVLGFYQILKLPSHKVEGINGEKEEIDKRAGPIAFRIIIFSLLINFIFHYYWGIEICCRSNGDYCCCFCCSCCNKCKNMVSRRRHRYNSHHHSSPHHYRAPHHSAPHRSAPHHAPHHRPHHRAHHGGHRRH